MVKIKFKVGDKVRILPKALNWNVPQAETGKVGVLDQYLPPNGFRIYMDKPWEQYNTRETWEVHYSHIELVIKPGQQLLFKFMDKQE